MITNEKESAVTARKLGISIWEVPFSGSMGTAETESTERRKTSMRKKNYIFTNKKHSDKAIMSTILGVISLASLGIVTYLSFRQGGVMYGGYGVTGVLATIYSLIGLILGILTLRDKDIYRIFPVLGTILNVIALGGISFLLYLGSRL